MLTVLWKIIKWMFILAIAITVLAFISFGIIGLFIELFGEVFAYILGGSFAFVLFFITPIALICRK